MAVTDYVYLCTGTFTFTLPTGVGNTNLYTIRNAGTGIISITGTSGQTVDGDVTGYLYQGDSATLIYDNTSDWEQVD